MQTRWQSFLTWTYGFLPAAPVPTSGRLPQRLINLSWEAKTVSASSSYHLISAMQEDVRGIWAWSPFSSPGVPQSTCTGMQTCCHQPQPQATRSFVPVGKDCTPKVLKDESSGLCSFLLFHSPAEGKCLHQVSDQAFSIIKVHPPVIAATWQKLSLPGCFQTWVWCMRQPLNYAHISPFS